MRAYDEKKKSNYSEAKLIRLFFFHEKIFKHWNIKSLAIISVLTFNEVAFLDDEGWSVWLSYVAGISMIFRETRERQARIKGRKLKA